MEASGEGASGGAAAGGCAGCTLSPIRVTVSRAQDVHGKIGHAVSPLQTGDEPGFVVELTPLHETVRTQGWVFGMKAAHLAHSHFLCIKGGGKDADLLIGG